MKDRCVYGKDRAGKPVDLSRGSGLAAQRLQFGIGHQIAQISFRPQVFPVGVGAQLDAVLPLSVGVLQPRTYNGVPFGDVRSQLLQGAGQKDNIAVGDHRSGAAVFAGAGKHLVVAPGVAGVLRAFHPGDAGIVWKSGLQAGNRVIAGAVIQHIDMVVQTVSGIQHRANTVGGNLVFFVIENENTDHSLSRSLGILRHRASSGGQCRMARRRRRVRRFFSLQWAMA